METDIRKKLSELIEVEDSLNATIKAEKRNNKERILKLNYFIFINLIFSIIIFKYYSIITVLLTSIILTISFFLLSGKLVKNMELKRAKKEWNQERKKELWVIKRNIIELLIKKDSVIQSLILLEKTKKEMNIYQKILYPLIFNSNYQEEDEKTVVVGKIIAMAIKERKSIKEKIKRKNEIKID